MHLRSPSRFIPHSDPEFRSKHLVNRKLRLPILNNTVTGLHSSKVLAFWIRIINDTLQILESTVSYCMHANVAGTVHINTCIGRREIIRYTIIVVWCNRAVLPADDLGIYTYSYYPLSEWNAVCRSYECVHVCVCEQYDKCNSIFSIGDVQRYWLEDCELRKYSTISQPHVCRQTDGQTDRQD